MLRPLLLRQAKPDDVFRFVTAEEIRAAWPDIRVGVGNRRAFWDGYIAAWDRFGPPAWPSGRAQKLPTTTSPPGPTWTDARSGVRCRSSISSGE